MNIKYSVRPIDNNVASESIFESISLLEALKKAEEQYQETSLRCIIVRCCDDEKMEEKTIIDYSNFNSI